MYSKEELFLAISTVIDPEVGFNLVEMGLIYDASCDEEGNAYVKMTLSTKACPMHQLIQQWVKEAVLKMANIKNVEIELVWEPEWNITMANENVKKALSRG
ncbi:MAG: DNA methyltransferase [Sulfurimonas sp. RIFOXYD12_FULL_33_39]|uniref:metal-sulfur cluster assembly factor n=1 Tax=unclassified Sulfurimonas TaxID=2623549 RepID=UPI0008AD76A8|nr:MULTISPECIES: metal-sulfur cluster assembly factor [unclassified Sulfurimonas]OHE06728.1 MAG: DNA methyltransferase [Sulfurimonas sp. RIFCSPLOWO2_12_FULL_34_6]OHE08914.1 MAG: DNA methyltransferase [Sulfurimonas sp. RIFOXYD12_FULL_33_39]OHE14224.1 MAG: DNA methyltransferase [Sulfurimonas sp. RIFOXYD2_FULL_34_21]DAB27988.1 MAG TPA: DNA methyltransferase [Sulfurimonas sp. UBA10385]